MIQKGSQSVVQHRGDPSRLKLQLELACELLAELLDRLIMNACGFDAPFKPFRPFDQGRLRASVDSERPSFVSETWLDLRIRRSFEPEGSIRKSHVAVHRTDAGWAVTVRSWSERSRGFIAPGSFDFVPSGVRHVQGKDVRVLSSHLLECAHRLDQVERFKAGKDIMVQAISVCDRIAVCPPAMIPRHSERRPGARPERL